MDCKKIVLCFFYIISIVSLYYFHYISVSISYIIFGYMSRLYQYKYKNSGNLLAWKSKFTELNEFMPGFIRDCKYILKDVYDTLKAKERNEPLETNIFDCEHNKKFDCYETSDNRQLKFNKLIVDSVGNDVDDVELATQIKMLPTGTNIIYKNYSVGSEILDNDIDYFIYINVVETMKNDTKFYDCLWELIHARDDYKFGLCGDITDSYNKPKILYKNPINIIEKVNNSIRCIQEEIRDNEDLQNKTHIYVKDMFDIDTLLSIEKKKVIWDSDYEDYTIVKYLFELSEYNH